ncbi:MAG: hypothetical protein DSM106950_13340 [Stigonema ocellatum SAG 48.90 = DSM 106950]|nr:hypothetical protein [Stigonema ocellatum SAG 48.90 = DSM 106950]
MVRLIFTAILLGLLTACSSIALTPTRQLVEKAIAFELQQTQQELSQQLDLDFRGFKINHLSITEQKPLTIQNLPAFHVLGTYDLTFNLPKRRLTQPQKPFDIYLQLQQEAKTWRLLIPESSSKDTKPVWHSYLIQ